MRYARTYFYIFPIGKCQRNPSFQEALEKYIEDNELEFKPTGKPYCNTDYIWPPLILFPDLTSDYYKDIFENEEKGR